MDFSSGVTMLHKNKNSLYKRFLSCIVFLCTASRSVLCFQMGKDDTYRIKCELSILTMVPHKTTEQEHTGDYHPTEFSFLTFQFQT